MSTALHDHGNMVPRGALILAGALVTFTLTMTAAMRIAHVPPAASPVLEREAAHVAPAQSRTLRFADRADGAVVITDVKAGRVVHVVTAGSQSGFIRGVMRGLARDRHMRGLGADAPFNLTLWRDGSLSLTDTATNREVELGAFGSTNRAAFAALLTDRES